MCCLGCACSSTGPAPESELPAPENIALSFRPRSADSGYDADDPSDAGDELDAGMPSDGGCQIAMEYFPSPSVALDISENGNLVLVRFDEVPYPRFALWSDAGIRILTKARDADSYSAVTNTLVAGAMLSPALGVYEISKLNFNDGGLATFSSPSGGRATRAFNDYVVGVLGNGSSLVWLDGEPQIFASASLVAINSEGQAAGRSAGHAVVAERSGLIRRLDDIDTSEALGISNQIVVGTVGVPVVPAAWSVDGGAVNLLDMLLYDFGSALDVSDRGLIVGYLGKFGADVESDCAIWTVDRILWASSNGLCQRVVGVADDGSSAAATCRTDAGVVACRLSIRCE